ncbi:MAG: hypothetical protein HY787_27120 [Deltaproteobacteria bacterium]|nr:hypothetical protein [Deltaproteobacteria bacterium]
MNPTAKKAVLLDLNNPVFQKNLFSLSKQEQREVLGTLKKLSKMDWDQVYNDRGLKWEVILSRSGPHGEKLYSFRIGKGFRGLACREGDWMRILSLHPDHDSTYQ